VSCSRGTSPTSSASGRVFLIRAAGRSPEEMLAELRRRLTNDPETERREVVYQVAQIARLRTEKLLGA
jgi:2-oxo-4-hydroxy-4-carboxy-5-ureidoimidazoline decarboxylase